jgi:hypothetical protein
MSRLAFLDQRPNILTLLYIRPQVFSRSIPRTLASLKQVKAVLSSKSFQFGGKYWLACAATLIPSLVGNDFLDRYRFIWVYITVAIVMQPKV